MGSAITPAEVRGEVERRLATLEPDVELLAADVASAKGRRVVRVFVDTESGVTHATCARVTGHLSDLLRDYSVEVSSPGPERPLSKPQHFERFVGRRVRVRTREAVDGRNDFKGELIDADLLQVTLAGPWGTVTVGYDQIRRANLLPPAKQDVR